MEAGKLPGVGAAERVSRIYRGAGNKRRQTGARTPKRKSSEGDCEEPEGAPAESAAKSGGHVNIRA